jgi:hypothetical protein
MKGFFENFPVLPSGSQMLQPYLTLTTRLQFMRFGMNLPVLKPLFTLMNLILFSSCKLLPVNYFCLSVS